MRGSRRAVQVTANWVNPVSGNWNSTTAWSTAPVFPNNNATTTFAVNIAATGAAYTVTLDSGPCTIDFLTLSGPEATLFTSKPLTVGYADIRGTLSLGGYSGIFDGTINLQGVLNAHAAYLVSHRPLTIAPTGVMNVLSGGPGFADTTTLDMPTTNSGTFNIDAATLYLDQVPFVNNGYLRLGEKATLNHSSGTVPCYNYGTITCNALTSATLELPISYHYGTVDIQSGSLIASGLSCQSNSRFVGAGTLAMKSGQRLLFFGNCSIDTNVDFNLATFGGTGTTVFAKSSALLGGYASKLGGAYTVANTGSMELSAFGFGCDAQNSGSWTIRNASYLMLSGQSTTNSGLMNLPVNARLHFSSASLTNTGTLLISSGGASTGTFSTFLLSSGTAAISNAGSITVDAPGCTAQVGVALQNSGTIRIDNGALEYPSTLTISHSTGSRYAGAGTLISNSTMNFAGASTFDNAQTIISTGTINGAGTVFLASQTNLNTATLLSGGTVSNLAGGTLNLAGSIVLNRYLTNSGLMNLNATINASTGTLLNSGTINVNGLTTVTTSSASRFRNTATINLNASLASSELLNEGTIQAGSDASVRLTNNGVADAGGFSLTLNSLKQSALGRYLGTGTIIIDAPSSSSSAFDNSGTALFENARTVFKYGTVNGSGVIRNFGNMWFQNTGTISAGGDIINESSGSLDLGSGTLLRQVVNMGTLNVGSVLYAFVNTPTMQTGTILNTGTVILNRSILAAPITNNGTIVLVNNAWRDLNSSNFTNNGLVSIQSGTLSLWGTTYLTAGSKIEGAGIFGLSTGTINLLADTTLTTSFNRIAGGTLNGPGGISFTGATTFESSSNRLATTLTNLGTMTFANNPVFAANTGTIINHSRMTVLGGGKLTVPNVLWNDGTMTVASFGTLILNSSLDGPGTLSTSGTVSFTGSSISDLAELSIAATGKVDIGNSDLVLNPADPTSTLANLRGWSGAGNLFTTTNGKAVGYASAVSLNLNPGDLWKGEALTANSIIVTPTFAGDANLDGKVNTIDFNDLAGSFGQANTLWFNGDFNYDASVNSIDFDLLVANYGKITPSASLGALIPEPTGLVASVTMLLGLRRRR